MRILITNDDGIHAPGLDGLRAIARALSDDVWVVAPETDQSGVAHSLSLNDPLRLREVAPRHFAVKGTPTDCVIMGVRQILPDARPDLVLSGVNRGQNVAEDVTYSGTIAGRHGGHASSACPSFALSQAYGPATRQAPRWACARGACARHHPQADRRGHSDPDVLVNINFPDCEPDDVKGVAVGAGPPRRRTCCASTSAPTDAAIRITGSPSRGARSRPSTVRTSRPSPSTRSP